MAQQTRHIEPYDCLRNGTVEPREIPEYDGDDALQVRMSCSECGHRFTRVYEFAYTVDELDQTKYREESYTEAQRRRIIEDLARWKIEYEDFRISDEEIDGYASELDAKGDGDLTDAWFSCVGEWLCSRTDVDTDGPKSTEEQFYRLLDGVDTGYGFIAEYDHHGSGSDTEPVVKGGC